MSRRRVVITGMGLVSCFGNDVRSFYQSLLAGKSGVSTITSFPCDEFSTRFAASVPEYDLSPYLDKKQARRVDRFIAFALTAAKEALTSAGFSERVTDPNVAARCGVIIGSGMGGMKIFHDNVLALQESPRRVSPFLIPYIITNMASGLTAQEYGFMGPNYSVSTACATSNHAIVNAANHIRRGEADLMICGGSEAAILPIGLAGFCSIKALSQRNDSPQQASRPWDKNRDGFVMGEGAGLLVLEELEHAKRRGAPILAEYLGGAFSCDAYHMTDPHPEGIGVYSCLEQTLRDAQLEACDINYINAHATSTPVGDIAEIRALKKMFPNTAEIAVNATKSMIGHCLGAAGGIEAITALCAILEGVIHPNINLEDQEEEMTFFAPREAASWKVKNALSTSFGFGGHNAIIALSPYR